MRAKSISRSSVDFSGAGSSRLNGETPRSSRLPARRATAEISPGETSGASTSDHLISAQMRAPSSTSSAVGSSACAAMYAVFSAPTLVPTTTPGRCPCSRSSHGSRAESAPIS